MVIAGEKLNPKLAVEVVIVDEITGRLMQGRRYSEGLHEAIEAKEGITVRRREPDLRHHHHPELLPPVSQAGGHDRYGADRGRRVHQDLQARSDAYPDAPADGPPGSSRPDLPAPSAPSSAPWWTRSRRCTRRAARCWSVQSRSRSRKSCAQMLDERGHPPLRAQRQAARARGEHRGPGRAARGHDHRHQHGRPRYRHHAGLRRGRSGRPAHHRHRAPREPPHRQPVARSRRSPGRPRLHPLLCLAGRRDHAPFGRQPEHRQLQRWFKRLWEEDDAHRAFPDHAAASSRPR